MRIAAAAQASMLAAAVRQRADRLEGRHREQDHRRQQDPGQLAVADGGYRDERDARRRSGPSPR